MGETKDPEEAKVRESSETPGFVGETTPGLMESFLEGDFAAAIALPGLNAIARKAFDATFPCTNLDGSLFSVAVLLLLLTGTAASAVWKESQLFRPETILGLGVCLATTTREAESVDFLLNSSWLLVCVFVSIVFPPWVPNSLAAVWYVDSSAPESGRPTSGLSVLPTMWRRCRLRLRLTKGCDLFLAWPGLSTPAGSYGETRSEFPSISLESSSWVALLSSPSWDGITNPGFCERGRSCSRSTALILYLGFTEGGAAARLAEEREQTLAIVF